MSDERKARARLVMAVEQWRAMEDELIVLRRALEGTEIPSYRVGAAEAFTLFTGLDATLAGMVEKSFKNLQETVGKPRRPLEQAGGVPPKDAAEV